jgi:hypothetical protein
VLEDEGHDHGELSGREAVSEELGDGLATAARYQRRPSRAGARLIGDGSCRLMAWKHSRRIGGLRWQRLNAFGLSDLGEHGECGAPPRGAG